MTALVAIILLLALIFGGIGLFVKGLFWLFVVALVLFVVGGLVGYAGRRTRV